MAEYCRIDIVLRLYSVPNKNRLLNFNEILSIKSGVDKCLVHLSNGVMCAIE